MPKVAEESVARSEEPDISAQEGMTEGAWDEGVGKTVTK
jgi:hypothetical protein